MNIEMMKLYQGLDPHDYVLSLDQTQLYQGHVDRAGASMKKIKTATMTLIRTKVCAMCLWSIIQDQGPLLFIHASAPSIYHMTR